MQPLRITLATCLMALLSACNDGSMLYETYDTIGQAEADGAFSRGWFPEWMPRDAINIHEYHDLDTNSQAISFEVSEPSSFRWPSICNPTINARRPKLKTRQFPVAVNKLDDIQECGEFFAVKDKDGLIHMWRR